MEPKWLDLPKGFRVNMAIPEGYPENRVECSGIRIKRVPFWTRLWNWLRGRQTSYTITYQFTVRSDDAEVGI
jgi:hypothetical protein